MQLTEKQANRFWSYVDPQESCWLWTGYTNPRGYGNYRVVGGMAFAHRVSYWLTFNELPAGLSVCHRCDNPSCVNPEHLFLGTAQDNTHDMRRKGRGFTPTPTITLNPDIARYIRSNYIPRERTCRMLAAQLGVSKSSVHRAIAGFAV